MDNDANSNLSESANLHQDNFQFSENSSRYAKLGLNQSRREEIGRRTKRILDMARCQFIKESISLPTVKLKYYACMNISPENVVVIANK